MESMIKQKILGLKNIFSSASLLLASVVFIISIFLGFSNVSATEESMVDIQSNSYNPKEMVVATAKDGNIIENENSKPFNDGKDRENYPDLGDDQVFPFVAGLDSYE